MVSLAIKLKLYTGLKESAKWIGYPILTLIALFLATSLFMLVSKYIFYFPPLLSLLGIVGFIVGWRSIKSEQ